MLQCSWDVSAGEFGLQKNLGSLVPSGSRKAAGFRRALFTPLTVPSSSLAPSFF